MKFINDVIKYSAYMVSSAKANLKADVAGSYLNWLWWVLEPMGLMVMYAVIFGWLFQNSIEYFPIFIFTGNMIWGFFNKVTTSSVSLIKQNEMLVSKIYVPKYVLLIVEMFIEGFKMLVEFGLTIILMVVFQVPVSLNLLWIIPIIIVLFVNVFGLGMIMTNLGVYIDDLAHAMRILMMVWMYFSGIFYDIRTMIPEPTSSLLLILNCPAFLIDSFRTVLINAAVPNVKELFAWLVIGILLSAIGIIIVDKNENDYVKRM